jgi:hypothetical protein
MLIYDETRWPIARAVEIILELEAFWRFRWYSYVVVVYCITNMYFLGNFTVDPDTT